MKQFISLVTAGAVTMAYAASSLAQSIETVADAPIPFTATDWTSGAGGVPSFSIPQFNPSLGTLDSVTLDLLFGLSTTLTILDNPTAGSYTTGDIITTTTVTVADAGNNLAASDITLPSAELSFSHLPVGASQSSGPLIQTGSSSATYTIASILSEFTGVGDISLPASTFTTTTMISKGGNTGATQSTTADLSGSVEYDYTSAVPEPAACSLLFLSLAGALPFFRRQRK